ELVEKYHITRLVLGLQRTNSAHADDPGCSEFFKCPDVGSMIEFIGQNAMTPGMTRQEHHLASSQAAGQEIVRRRTKRGFYFDPFLVGEAFDMVEATATDDTDTMFRHAGRYNGLAETSRAICDNRKS